MRNGENLTAAATSRELRVSERSDSSARVVHVRRSDLLKYIPLPNPGQDCYANASQKRTINDDKMGQRVDFVNERTGNWSFYYHFDDSTVSDPLAAASVPGFPAVTPTRRSRRR